jgi:predicted nucleic acid-binding protein
MKVYFDTNIVIDILQKREPFFDTSLEVLTRVSKGYAKGIIGANAIVDIFYVINKNLKNNEDTINSIFDVLEILSLVDTTAQDIFNAKHLNMPDYEDAVVATIAFRENASYIVTRNIADYTNSPVPAITPTDFIAKIV